MTMPHLGNCPHKPGTWCLPCVREEWERREAEADALRAKLSAAEARATRYERALRRIASEDYRGNRPQSAVVAHEALNPPTSEGASDGA